MDVHALLSLFQVYDYNLSSKSEQHTVINRVMCHRNITCVMRVWQELIHAPTITFRRGKQKIHINFHLKKSNEV